MKNVMVKLIYNKKLSYFIGNYIDCMTLRCFKKIVLCFAIIIIANSCVNDNCKKTENMLTNSWILASKFIDENPIPIYYKINSSELNKIYFNEDFSYNMKEYSETHKENIQNGVWSLDNNCTLINLKSNLTSNIFIVTKLTKDSLDIKNEKGGVHLIFIRESSSIGVKFKNEIDKLYKESVE